MKEVGKIFIIILSLTIYACGGDGSSSSTNIDDNIKTGFFVDSAVVGIGYSTETQSGITNSNGEFNYLAGENITFFIGDIEFPIVLADRLITPLSIAGTADINDQVVVNIARFIQSIDSDGDPSNGIIINEEIRNSGEGFTINFASQSDIEFEEEVANFMALAKPDSPALVSRNDAINNLQSSLNSLTLPRESGAVQWLDAVIGSMVYTYELPDGNSGWSWSSTGFGPRIDTASGSESVINDWPDDKPRLDIRIELAGFMYDVGIESGTIIDLSDFNSEVELELTFGVTSPATGIVGEDPIYAIYEANVGKGSSSWISGSAGIVNIVEFLPKSNTGDSYQDYDADIWLKDIILIKTSSNEELNNSIWPNEVTIPSAHFCKSSNNCIGSLGE